MIQGRDNVVLYQVVVEEMLVGGQVLYTFEGKSDICWKIICGGGGEREIY